MWTWGRERRPRARRAAALAMVRGPAGPQDGRWQQPCSGSSVTGLRRGAGSAVVARKPQLPGPPLLKSRLALGQEGIDTFAELVTAKGDGLCDGLLLEEFLHARLVGALHHYLAHGEHRRWSRGDLLGYLERFDDEFFRSDHSIAEADCHCLEGVIAPVQHDHLLGAQAANRPGQRLQQTEVR